MHYLVSVDHKGMAAHLTRSDVIVMGFKKCHVSNAVNGPGDDMLWNCSEEYRNVTTECQPDEGTDCGDGDSGTDW